MTLLLLACTAPGVDSALDSPAPDTGPFPPGRLALRFEIDSDVRDAMHEDALGPFTGSFWRADEVEGVGPVEGAEDLASIVTDAIDLRGDTVSEVVFTSEDLPPIDVVVLGFMDSDGNADPDAPDPDPRDPVTLPHQNRFTVVSGETTEVTVFLGFLYPSS